MASLPQLTDSERDTVRQAARDLEPDFFLSALLAPRAVRDDLVTLAAYLGEIARIPLITSEPMLAEIRLQWWREALAAGTKGFPSGNPVADGLSEMAGRRKLEMDDLLAPIDGRCEEISAPMLEEAALLAYLDRTWGSAFRLTGAILGADPTGSQETAPVAAGRAYGAARTALRLPALLAHGLVPWPACLFDGQLFDDAVAARTAVSHATSALQDLAQRNLEQLRQTGPGLPRAMRRALLPVALIEPYFRALQRPGHDILRHVADLSPLARAGRLWLASVTGRV